jgi:hypothetical protein
MAVDSFLPNANETTVEVATPWVSLFDMLIGDGDVLPKDYKFSQSLYGKTPLPTRRNEAPVRVLASIEAQPLSSGESDLLQPNRKSEKIRDTSALEFTGLGGESLLPTHG